MTHHWWIDILCRFAVHFSNIIPLNSHTSEGHSRMNNVTTDDLHQLLPYRKFHVRCATYKNSGSCMLLEEFADSCRLPQEPILNILSFLSPTIGWVQSQASYTAINISTNHWVHVLEHIVVLLTGHSSGAGPIQIWRAHKILSGNHRTSAYDFPSSPSKSS